MKKVSVIINFHNAEKFLDQSITSVLSQSYKNFELILWDNCSNDKSKEICNRFKDRRIKYFYKSKKTTLYKARNLAIKATKGDLIAFLDSDDWWHRNYLSSRQKFFNKKKYDYFYCNSNIVLEEKKNIFLYKKFNLPNGKILDELAKDYFIIISGVIFRKKIFDEQGYFNESLNIIGDYDFIIKISNSYNAHSSNYPYLNYRIHKNNYSKLNLKIFYLEYKRWFKMNLNSNFFKNNINHFSNKLNYYELNYLLQNKKKKIYILKKIFKLKNFLNIVQFLILFFIPKMFYKFIKK